MNPILKHHLIETGALEALRHSQPQVVVLSLSEHRPVPTNMSESLPSNKNRGLTDRTANIQGSFDFVMLSRRVMDAEAQGLACCVYAVCQAAQEADFWVLLHELDLRGQSIWDGNVIGVHDGNVSPLRERTARISSLSQTTIRYLVEPDSTVFRSIARSNGPSPIGRAEVDDDEFKLTGGLAEYALDR